MTSSRTGRTESALARPAPAPILGFAFYVLGTGCVALGVAQLGVFAENIHAAALAPLPSWAFVIGQAMVLVGLAIAWRATKGTARRLLGAAATLWLTLLVVELQQGRLADALVAHAPRAFFAGGTASMVGRSIVLLVVAAVAHGSGRAFASRTWATTLGAMLVFADAWTRAWPTVTRASFGHATVRLLYATPTMVVAGAGLLLAGGGLYATGRAILRGVTIDARSPTPERGLPLFTDAMTAIAGLALAHAASVAAATHLRLSMRDVADTATLGGELAAWTVVVVALRRMAPLTKSSLGYVLAVLGALGLEAVLRYVVWSRGLFSASGGAALATGLLPFVAGIRVLLTIRALRAAATALGRLPVAPEPRDRLRARLRVGTNLLGASLVASFFVPDLAGPGIPVFVQALAVLLGALALYVMISAMADTRRIETQPIR